MARSANVANGRDEFLVRNALLHRDGEIGTTHEDSVDTVHGGNLRDMFESRNVFNLHNNGRSLTAVGNVIGHRLCRVSSGARRTGISSALIPEMGRFDNGFCLLRAGHMRDEDAGRAAVQRTADLLRRIVCDAHEAGPIRGAKRGQAEVSLQPAKRRVLGVDAKNIELGEAEYLRDNGRRRLDERSNQQVAIGQPFAKGVDSFSHQIIPRVCRWQLLRLQPCSLA